MSGIIRNLFKTSVNEGPLPLWKQYIGVVLVLTCTSLIALRRILAKLLRYFTRRRLGAHPQATVVAFFHPITDQAAGGERVLWRAIEMLLSSERLVHIVIYTSDAEKSPSEILDKVRHMFRLEMKQRNKISFVYIRSRFLLNFKLYPTFTLLCLSLGSLVTACECVIRATPDIFLESTGFSFTMAIAKLLVGCYTAAYVHYPTVSTDMIYRVTVGTGAFNNAEWIARSKTISFFKILYYRVLAMAYGFCGQFTDIVMCNSTWTLNHIESLWFAKKRTPRCRIVFPPCDTSVLRNIPLNVRGREKVALSIGQFRPEKNHYLQLEAFALAVNKCESISNAKLSIIGGLPSGQECLMRLQNLRQYAKALGIADKVEFVVNCDFDELCKRLSSASIGIHTMKDEHFGIAVVEMMAAGLVAVAHRSGGPKTDIISEGETGFLAESAEEYADILVDVLGNDNDKFAAMRTWGRESSLRYSNSSFDKSFRAAMQPLLVRAKVDPSSKRE